MNILKKILACLLLVLPFGCDQQDDEEPTLKNDPIVSTGVLGFGWQKEPNPEKAPRYAAIRQTATASLPASMDLRPEMSPVEDQGPINSCVAQSIVGALEFLQIKNGIPKNKRFLDMSRMFLYYNARNMAGLQTVDRGCYISHGILCTTDIGMVTEKRWPYTYSRLYKKPGRAMMLVAKKKLVKDYHYIWENHVDNTKAALAEGYPVVFGTTLFSSFWNVGKDGMVPIPAAGEAVLGGHAMLIVGYTDSCFIVRNSWGAKWGDKGYCYFPFGYFSLRGGAYDPSFDFWVLRLQTNLFTRDLDDTP